MIILGLGLVVPEIPGTTSPKCRGRLAAGVIALAAGLAVVPAHPAMAHVRADIVFVDPAAGERLSGDADAIDVVLEARSDAGTGIAEFTLFLDRRPVDRNGRVGAAAAFTSLSLRAGDRLRIRIPLPDAGRHELRVRYAPDEDDPKADVVRRFTVSAPTSPPTGPTATPPPTAETSVGPAFVTERPDSKESGGTQPLLVGGLVAAAAIAGAAAAFVVVRRLRPG
jgi:hypothetical protein